VAFSLDGRWIAATAINNEIRVWDARTLRPKTTLRGHTAFVTALTFDPDSSTIYSSSEDRTVKIWRVD
jgi:WD40 repeat protein